MDLWENRGPAYGLNGTLYTAELYASRAVEIIKTHNKSQPLFLYLAFQMTHTPLDPPKSFLRPSLYPQDKTSQRLAFNAMALLLDDGVANVTAALRAEGMWDSTLLLATADNGAWIVGKSGIKGGANGGGSNYPVCTNHPYD